jgi:hypothetical protein
MAQLLSSRFSAERCVNSGRRHQRLSKQVVNDETLSNQIQPVMDDCNLKLDTINQKEETREDAYDDLVLADRFLDDEIRSIFDSCKKYDRDHPAEQVLIKIFPDEKFGELVRLPYAIEISEANKLVLRLESLGAEHSLNPFVAKLNAKIDAAVNALAAQSTAIRDEKMAEAEVEIAKEALVRQFELNYLEARRKYGKATAEKLFPRIQSRNTSVEPDEPGTDGTPQV